jgi:hypothetical protein
MKKILYRKSRVRLPLRTRQLSVPLSPLCLPYSTVHIHLKVVCNEKRVVLARSQLLAISMGHWRSRLVRFFTGILQSSFRQRISFSFSVGDGDGDGEGDGERGRLK